MSLDAEFTRFSSPGREWGPIAFWFWNDDLDENELLRQLHEFHAAGLGGVALSARIGLSRRIGYLTDEYFRLVRLVVDECARLGLSVILYDEASYPSGSANGAVVAENPDYAARALIEVHLDVTGPAARYWRPSAGRSLVHRLAGVWIGQCVDGVVDPDTVRALSVIEPGLVRIEVGEGDWRVMACFDVPSGGTIRGAWAEQEDGTALAPAAGDLLNPDAVAAFVRLTHDRYAAALGDHLGTTVVAMFTDEPCLSGRSPKAKGKPYSPGISEQLSKRTGWDTEKVQSWMPALWHDFGPDTAWFRESYERALQDRLVEVFYRAQAQWCEKVGIALTGHPAESNDMDSLRSLHWPGQDVVWRWVLPSNGLDGAHSVSAKAAASAGAIAGRPRVLTEVLGAYGWQLSLDEVKWLVDWHLARGTGLFVLHAFFYSIRGQRAFESEPDLGIHNPWWPLFGELVRYMTRMSWLLGTSAPRVRVAVVGTGHDLPWRVAGALYRNQIDFHYVDDTALTMSTVDNSELCVGAQRYSTVIVDNGHREVSLSEASREVLSRLDGVLSVGPDDELDAVVAAVPRDIQVSPAAPDLRIVQFDGIYAFFNEGEELIETRVALGGLTAEWWDPLRSTRERAVFDEDGVVVRLDRRESRLLVLGESAIDDPSDVDSVVITVDGPWSASDQDGRAIDVPLLGDWAVVRGTDRLSGTVHYRTEVVLSDQPASVLVDLGVVGEAARLVVNGNDAGVAMWPPHRINVPGHLWRAGTNTIEVAVTNSAANQFEGAQRVSGLVGPVAISWTPARY